MDINCEDWRTRGNMWDQTRHALEFFHGNLPFADMHPDNELTSSTNDYCLAKPGDVYAIYLPKGGSTRLTVPAGTFSVKWYNPRAGGHPRDGTVMNIVGPGAQSVGQAPSDPGKDWTVLVRRVGG